MTQMTSRRSRHYFMVYVTGLLMATLAIVLQVPDKTHAAGACQTQTFIYDGTTSVNVTHWGIRANILALNPSLCTGNTWGVSGAYVMSAAGNGGPGYAQVGYLRKWNTLNSIHFSQYRRDANSTTVSKWGSSVPSGNSPLYQIIYVKSSGFFQMWAGGTLLDTTNFDPTIYWGLASTWRPLYEGETHDNQDDMPGNVALNVYFQNMAIKTDVNNNVWGTFNVGLQITGDALNRYANAKDSNSQIRIWTK